MEIRYQGRAEPACEKAAFSASMVYVSRAASLRLTGISLLPTGVFLTSREQGRAGLHSGFGVRNGSVCVWWGGPDTGTPV